MTDYQAHYADSYAMLIGINTYKVPQFVPLGEAEANATAFANLLSDNRFGFKVKTLLGNMATKEAIQEQMHRLVNAKPDDRILIYFAGYGYTVEGQADTEIGYLACYDSQADKHATALELEEVLDVRRQSPAKHVAFIFDTCFSGQALGLTRTIPTTAEHFLTRRAYQVISAGTANQTMSDYSSMADAIIDRLKQEDVSTINSLGLYVQRVMAGRTGNMQIPQFGSLAGSEGGDFIFEAKADPLDVPEIDPDDVTEVLTSFRRPVVTPGTAPSKGFLARYGLIIAAVIVGIVAIILTIMLLGNNNVPDTDSGLINGTLTYSSQTTQKDFVPFAVPAVDDFDGAVW